MKQETSKISQSTHNPLPQIEGLSAITYRSNEKSIYSGEKPLGYSEEVVYQPLKLLKQIENRYIGAKQVKGLSRCDGLSWIPPDSDFRESIFTDLLYEYSEGGESKCEILMVVAMYNEEVQNFKDTMLGIASNLEDFRKVGLSPEQLCVVVIVDGIKPFMETFKRQRSFFSQFFKEEKIKEFFHVDNVLNCKLPDEQDEDEFAHCFFQKAYFDTSEAPIQLIFCVKQKNRRKLNSHLWFFGGFCEMFNPKYCILLDVGTKPLPKSLFYLYEAMKTDDRVAGCCGEIRPMDPNYWKLVVGAQVVEYKFSHIFDKALESVIGYISVLPGAFSAYVWEALQGEPLWEDYFKSLCHPELMDAFHSNIYLAEDRVLCLSLVSKAKHSYILRYVKKSIAETDVPESISVLMAQRRRWINGSWFALIDSIKNAKKVFSSGHHRCRKIAIIMQMGYYCINVVFQWFLCASFFLAFAISIRRVFPNETKDSNLAGFGNWLILFYVWLLIVSVSLSLGVKPRRVDDIFKYLAICFGFYMIFIMILQLMFLFSHSITYSWVGPLMIVSVSFFAINVIAFWACIPVLKGVIHFVFLSPSYVNIFLVYAMCNIHDCSWGSRPDQLSEEEKNRLEEYEEFRARWTIIWALSNATLAYFFDLIDKQGRQNLYYWAIYAVAFIGLAILACRFIFAMIYLVWENFCYGHLEVNHELAPITRPRKRFARKNGNALEINNLDDGSLLPDGNGRNGLGDYGGVDYLGAHRGGSRSGLSDTLKGTASIDKMNETLFYNDQQDITQVDINADYIKSIRRRKNISIKMLSRMTNIRKYRLRVIENGIDKPTPDEAAILRTELAKA